MSDETEIKESCLVIPEIGDSGSAGTQDMSQKEFVPEIYSPPWKSMGDYVTGLAAEKPKSLKSDAAALILAKVVDNYEYDIKDMKNEIRSLRNQLDEAKEKTATYRERINSLIGRLRAISKERRIKNIIITIGSLLIPISYNIYKDNTLIAFLVGILGLFLIIIGWMRYTSEEDDK